MLGFISIARLDRTVFDVMLFIRMPYTYTLDTKTILKDMSAFDSYMQKQPEYISSSFNSDKKSISCVFGSSLSSDAVNKLTSYVQAFPNPNVASVEVLKDSNITPVQVDNVDYTTVLTFTYYEVTDRMLVGAHIISCITPNTPDDSSSPAFGYDMRVMDISNNKTLGTCTVKTTKFDTQTIDFTNVSSAKTTIELQVRKHVPGCYVTVKALTWRFASS